jgi:hypothetical protein
LRSRQGLLRGPGWANIEGKAFLFEVSGLD